MTYYDLNYTVEHSTNLFNITYSVADMLVGGFLGFDLQNHIHLLMLVKAVGVQVTYNYRHDLGEESTVANSIEQEVI